MPHVTEKELVAMGLTPDPLDPTALIRVDQAVDHRPDASWTTEQLQAYVVAGVRQGKVLLGEVQQLRGQIDTLVRQTAYERWWTGCALSFLRGRLKSEKKWSDWQTRERISRTTAWRAIQLHETYADPEAIRGLPITEVYRALKLCRVQTDEVDEAQETGEPDPSGDTAAACDVPDQHDRSGFGKPIRKADSAAVLLPFDNDATPSEAPASESHHELSPSERAAILRSGRQCPEHGIVVTPPEVAQFLYELLSPLRPKTVLDVASGNGDLSRPWRDSAQVIEYELAFGSDFFKCPGHIEADLVLCNPPFGQEKEFLGRIIEVVPVTAPIALFVTHRVRLGSYESSHDWRWCRDEWPPITSIVSLPRGVFKGVNETIEILIFRASQLLPHYFLTIPDKCVLHQRAANPEQRTETIWPPKATPFARHKVEKWKGGGLTELEEDVRRFFEDKSWFVGGPIPLRLLYGAASMSLVQNAVSDERTEEVLANNSEAVALKEQMQHRQIDPRYHGGLALLYFRLCRGMAVLPDDNGLAS